MKKLRIIFRIVFIIGIIIALYFYGKTAVLNGEKYTPSVTEHISEPDKGTEGKKSINEATKYDIKKVKGFGETHAKRIIEYRNQVGGFKGMEDLINIYQIGEERYERLRSKFSL